MNDSEFAIETHGLSKEYADRVVLRQIDLALAGGQIVCLMGGNGAGKTTLLCCLASLMRPTAGEVRWFGRRAADVPSARRWVGMVAHESRLYPQLTLRENLVFSGRMYGIDQPLSAANRWLVEMNMSKHADRFPMHVSRGMRQRISLARGLLHEPHILLLDEPFAGLDDAGTIWLTERLHRLRDAGRLVCLTTHDAAKATQLADRVWVLRRGRLCPVSQCGEPVAIRRGRPARVA
ncbi:MAG: sodium ABC transporter ATP-binding protein [Planctomycetaceae bacterium]|nr:sodium ABC transporter ATP-binding protein [Planctomycetaceae bacterium]